MDPDAIDSLKSTSKVWKAPLFLAVHVVSPTIVGFIVYLLWRSPNLRWVGWMKAVGLDRSFHEIRAWSDPLRGYVPEWLLFSLPDGLWVYALTAGMVLIWAGERGLVSRLWVACGLILGAGAELLQALDFIPGTFDWHDMIASVSAAAVALLAANRCLTPGRRAAAAVVRPAP